MSYIKTMEYYSGVKKITIMKFSGKWIELEIIIVSEVTQTKTMINTVCSEENSHLVQ